MYNKEIIRRLKSRAVLRQVVGSFIPLRKKYEMGRSKKVTGYEGFCPFHYEKHPSFSLYQIKNGPNKGTWGCKCFGGCMSGWEGDVFDFVMRIQSVDFNQAYKIVNERRSSKKLFKIDNQMEIPFGENLFTGEIKLWPKARIYESKKELHEARWKIESYFGLIDPVTHFKELIAALTGSRDDLPF